MTTDQDKTQQAVALAEKHRLFYDGKKELTAMLSDHEQQVRADERQRLVDASWKDGDTAKLVNKLRDIAIEFHGAQQLRERIAHEVVPAIASLQAKLEQEQQDKASLRGQNTDLDVACAKLEARNQQLLEDLQFVERWANHHGAKPTMTPQEALSCIQHYPPILAITRSYKDGVVPATRNPWAELKQSKARVRELKEAFQPLIDKVNAEGSAYVADELETAIAALNKESVE